MGTNRERTVLTTHEARTLRKVDNVETADTVRSPTARAVSTGGTVDGTGSKSASVGGVDLISRSPDTSKITHNSRYSTDNSRNSTDNSRNSTDNSSKSNLTDDPDTITGSDISHRLSLWRSFVEGQRTKSDLFDTRKWTKGFTRMMQATWEVNHLAGGYGWGGRRNEGLEGDGGDGGNERTGGKVVKVTNRGRGADREKNGYKLFHVYAVGDANREVMKDMKKDVKKDKKLDVMTESGKTDIDKHNRNKNDSVQNENYEKNNVQNMMKYSEKYGMKTLQTAQIEVVGSAMSETYLAARKSAKIRHRKLEKMRMKRQRMMTNELRGSHESDEGDKEEEGDENEEGEDEEEGEEEDVLVMTVSERGTFDNEGAFENRMKEVQKDEKDEKEGTEGKGGKRETLGKGSAVGGEAAYTALPADLFLGSYVLLNIGESRR